MSFGEELRVYLAKEVEEWKLLESPDGVVRIDTRPVRLSGEQRRHILGLAYAELPVTFLARLKLEFVP